MRSAVFGRHDPGNAAPMNPPKKPLQLNTAITHTTLTEKSATHHQKSPYGKTHLKNCYTHLKNLHLLAITKGERTRELRSGPNRLGRLVEVNLIDLRW